ncbi:MAG: hypothetical protein K0S25_1839, partial [Bacillus sp. (in: firmicutes)]|nr:hypothetical protein [Bacillus sp. (in: firmicutes)]
MLSVRNWKSNENLAILISVLMIVINLLPLFLLGENAHIRVHDNLDSNIAWYRVLINSGEMFGSLHSTIPQIINGLPRSAFGTEFSGIVWLHSLFSPMTAYALSQSITRFVAFLGMYLLLKKHFVIDQEKYLIRVGVALAFALTPFWPSGMLSTLGHPLALWAFLNIRKRDFSWREWLVLTLLPLYSSFVLGFFFFLVAMGLLWLRDLIVKKKWNIIFLTSIAYMTSLYLAVEYRLVASLVFGEGPTSRDEFLSSKLSIWHTIRLVFKNFTLGHTHVMTLHTMIILPLVLLVLYLLIKNQQWKTEKRFMLLLLLNFVLSVWYAFWFYKGWEPLKEKFHLLNTFNFARFHFLRPLVIYVGFALALSILWDMKKHWKRMIIISMILQVLFLTGFNEEIRYRIVDYPSFKEFYAEKQFQEIN